jgi:hypothetical protein
VVGAECPMSHSILSWLRRRPAQPGCLWAAAGGASGLAVLAVLLIVSAIGRADTSVPAPTPILTILAHPSPTPSPTLPPTLPASPTTEPTLTPLPGAGEGFGVGTMVEVSGTEGDGLRLRSAPDLDASIHVLGVENEVFMVSDGPIESDGFVWWYLVNLVDERKSGWAVGRFLRPLSPR